MNFNLKAHLFCGLQLLSIKTDLKSYVVQLH